MRKSRSAAARRRRPAASCTHPWLAPADRGGACGHVRRCTLCAKRKVSRRRVIRAHEKFPRTSTAGSAPPSALDTQTAARCACKSCRSRGAGPRAALRRSYCRRRGAAGRRSGQRRNSIVAQIRVLENWRAIAFYSHWHVTHLSDHMVHGAGGLQGGQAGVGRVGPDRGEERPALHRARPVPLADLGGPHKVAKRRGLVALRIRSIRAPVVGNARLGAVRPRKQSRSGEC